MPTTVIKTDPLPEIGTQRIEPAEQTASGAGEADGKIDSARMVLLVSLVVGIGFRLVQYLQNRSLWLDEALATSIYLENSVRELLSPSVSGGVAPGFYILQRISAQLFGTNELALRAVPFAAGVAAIFLFLAVARRAATPPAVPLAFALVCISPFLIYYSSEAKRYSLDVACSLVLLLLALDLYERGVSIRRLAVFAGVGVATVFFSFPAAFVLAGTTLGLLAATLREGDRAAASRLSGVVLAGAALLVLPLLRVVGGLGDAAGGFWSSGFMPVPPRSLEEWAWFPDTFNRLFRDPLGAHNQAATSGAFYQTAAGMLGFAAGTAWMWSRRRNVLLILLGPVLVALIASALHLYPFGAKWLTGGRSILYLAPVFFLLIAEGAVQLWRNLRGNLRPVGVAVMGLLILPPLTEDVIMIPYGRAEMRPILEYIQEAEQPGDLLYVHYDAKPAFRFYASSYGFEPGEYLLGDCSRYALERYLETIDRFRGVPRVWLLFGAGKGAQQFGERAFILRYADRIGSRIDDQVALGTYTYLYDFSRPPDSDGPVRVQIPKLPYDNAESCAIYDL